jgi:hypothetical protein
MPVAVTVTVRSPIFASWVLYRTELEVSVAFQIANAVTVTPASRATMIICFNRLPRLED